MHNRSLAPLMALGFACTLGWASPSFAQTAPAAKEAGKDASKDAAPAPKRYEIRGQARTPSGAFNYRAVAQETHLTDDKGKPLAAIFSTAYFRDGTFAPEDRPIAFIFNGGPGSASVWLHLGVFGPKRVAVPSDATDDGAAPYRLVDNPHTLLDVADLVFIDPVGTGFSRTLGEEDPKKYFGVTQDADYLARFIRKWLSENKRWNSPKYLAGESYGTTRVAALTRALTGGWLDVAINGAMLISSITDFQTARFAPGNDTPHIGFLPTFAATAWYHGKVDKSAWNGSLENFLAEVRSFAVGDYATALLMGSAQSAEARRAVIAKLARYSGLTEDYIEQTNLRISAQRFFKQLLRDRGLTVGRLDSRYTGVDYDGAGETPDNDPSAFGIDASYTAAMHDYLTRSFGVDIDRDYQILSGDPGRSWAWNVEGGQGWPAYVNVTPWLGEGMRQNKDMRVMLMSGYFDLATPFFSAEISLQRNGVPQDRLTRKYYEAGHMMYVHEPSLAQMAADARAFVTGK